MHQRWNLGAGLAVLLLYVITSYTMPKHVFWSPDEGGKLLESHAIGWQGGLTYGIPYGARAIDPELRFYPRLPDGPRQAFPYPLAGPDGEVRFHWPIWFPLLSGLALHGLGVSGLYLIPLLSGWLIALVSGSIVHRFNPHLTALTILVVGFATPVCFYSLCFWEHTLASLLGLIAVAVLLASPAGSPIVLLKMLPALTAAVMLRVEMIAFAAVALVVWATGVLCTPRQGALLHDGGARTRSHLLAAVLAAGAVVVVAMSLPSRHQLAIATLPARLADTLEKLPRAPRSAATLLVNAAHDEGPALPATWMVLASAALAGCAIAPFLASPRAEAAVVLPSLTARAGANGT